jgi:chemotaxis protein MotB
MARRAAPAGGAPEWIVTFADLMSLLLCFFILLISFSTQETAKMQIMAGAMREAFGSQPVQRRAGIIERSGLPDTTERDHLSNDEPSAKEEEDEKSVASQKAKPEKDTLPGPSGNITTLEGAANEIRQAIRADASMAALATQVIFEDTPEGLKVSVSDGDRRSIYPAGEAGLTAPGEALVTLIGRTLSASPARITVEGHAAHLETGSDANQDRLWALSVERAVKAEAILRAGGFRADRIKSVSGLGSADPLLREDPSLPGNRRVTFLVTMPKAR